MGQMHHWGHRLGRLLIENRMTQSDLARLIWNEERPDARGYTHVVGKDRVSAYINRGVVPDDWVLNAIAKVFKTTAKALCPEAFAIGPKTPASVMRIETIPGSEQVLMKVNQVLDAVIAAEIFQIISKAGENVAGRENGAHE
jgi:hypothetical protein